MGSLPREAREGIMRVWLEILRERHPGVTWVPAERESRSLSETAAADHVTAADGVTEAA
jgi:hypothetical protein